MCRQYVQCADRTEMRRKDYNMQTELQCADRTTMCRQDYNVRQVYNVQTVGYFTITKERFTLYLNQYFLFLLHTGPSLVSHWSLTGPSLVSLVSHWFSLVLHWSVTGISLVSHYYVIGLSLVSPWSLTGISLVSHWSFTGPSLVSHWYLIIALIFFFRELHALATMKPSRSQYAVVGRIDTIPARYMRPSTKSGQEPSFSVTRKQSVWYATRSYRVRMKLQDGWDRKREAQYT
ncbi:hypothetical protein Btru_066048 [Bulinus truncatus]|nr:hypothetical protein Btru_066048 [Bulinus truncatus]